MGSTVLPGLRYKELSAAMQWPCRCFGFDWKLVVLERTDLGPDHNSHAYAQAAIDWPWRCLGSKQKLVVPNESGVSLMPN